VLEGTEVYAFSPSTITVVEGDTVRFTLVNPEDDPHSFILPGLAAAMPGQTITHATYFARRPGIFPIACDVPGHMPMMSGELVVLSTRAVVSANDEPAPKEARR